MKKKLLITLLVTTLAVPVYADFDYSVFDEMSVDELKEVQTYVQDRIDEMNSEKQSEDSSENGIWEIKYYVDEFKQPTQDGYITTHIALAGTFSNSATTNSLLYVVPLFDDNGASFKLAEYGSSFVKGYRSDGTIYNVSVLDPEGNKTTMKGILRDNSDRVSLFENDVPTFYDILKMNGKVIVYMEEKKNTNCNYLFTIEDSSYFDETYTQIFDSYPVIDE